MLSTTCCIVVLHPVNNVVLHSLNNCCQQPLFSCSGQTIVVQLLLTAISKLVSSTIVSSCPNNIVTIIVLCQHRTTIDRTIPINIVIQLLLHSVFMEYFLSVIIHLKEVFLHFTHVISNLHSTGVSCTLHWCNNTL